MTHPVVDGEEDLPAGYSPLLLPGFASFNSRRFGLEHRFRTFGDVHEGSLSTVLYADRRGRLVVPPNIPYTPIEMSASPDLGPTKRQRLWFELMGMLAAEMKTMGVRGFLPLSPEISDVRPWQWRGFEAQIRYTFILTFPLDAAQRDRDVRRRIRKAAELGLVCTKQTDPAVALEPIRSTERRQGFSYHVTTQDLADARALLGDDRLRMYTCHLPDGRVVSTKMAICNPGSVAIGWIAGTSEPGLRVGASQFVMDFMLSDLEASGSRGIDLAGGNLESVSFEKTNWAAELKSYPVVSTFSPRSVGIAAKKWLRTRNMARRQPDARVGERR